MKTQSLKQRTKKRKMEKTDKIKMFKLMQKYLGRKENTAEMEKGGNKNK